LFESEEEASIYRNIADVKTLVPDNVFKKKKTATVQEDILEEIDLHHSRKCFYINLR
jgi:hypothetical protein